jgi:hypothetical protein
MPGEMSLEAFYEFLRPRTGIDDVGQNHFGRKLATVLTTMRQRVNPECPSIRAAMANPTLNPLLAAMSQTISKPRL